MISKEKGKEINSVVWKNEKLMLSRVDGTPFLIEMEVEVIFTTQIIDLINKLTPKDRENQWFSYTLSLGVNLLSREGNSQKWRMKDKR